MSKSTVVGGVAVAAVVALKFLAKAGAFALVFGGAHVAADTYAASVTHVKALAQDFNAKNQDEQIEINEAGKVILHHVYLADVNDQVLPDIDQNQMDQALQESKAEQIKDLRSQDATAANLDLVRRGWVEKYQYETLSHAYIASFTISKADL
ncbi:hypothetical protein DFV88_24760 [Salmonella enterica subsp. enterica serovar Newport]|nr:hypothetical protein [Salmonella enterica subsp. enterica serovar Newport]